MDSRRSWRWLPPLKSQNRNVTQIEPRAGALLAIKKQGKWERVGARRAIGVQLGDVKISYRTPFQPLTPLAELLRYQRRLVGGKENLPYGLDIWYARKKVLNVEWTDEGAIEIISYEPGEWERAFEGASG
jgi:hypothetical protein